MKKSEVAQVYKGADEKSWQELLDDLRPQGKWIGDEDYASYLGCYEAYKCNKCGYGLHWLDYINSDVPKNFCPNCGAKMMIG